MMNNLTRRFIWFVVLAAVVAMPLVCAFAMMSPSGSEVMMISIFLVAGLFLLFVLAIPIALVEGLHLMWWFKVKWQRAALILALPNFVTLVLALAAWFASWMMFPIAFVLACAVEWPFYYWALGEREKRLRLSLLAPVLINVLPFAFAMCLGSVDTNATI